MDWLTAGEADEKISEGTGLLLAPINLTQPDTADTQEQEPDSSAAVQEDFTSPQDTSENDFFVDDLSGLSSEILELHEAVKNLQTSLEVETPPQNNQINDNEVAINLDDDTDIQKAWQETAAGLNLSLDEPPPELWTRIGEADEDDDSEVEYEQGMSLQGAAYVQKREHGKNFTERLHYTLKGRKQKAEELRKEEEQKKNHHPYVSHAVIMCATMLMVMGVACLALWFVRSWLPEKLKLRNEEQHVVVEEPAPEVVITLSEDLTSPDVIEPEEVTEPSPDIEPEPEVEIKIPVTFEDFLEEGNNAYNLGMYNMAVINFFKAIDQNSSDVRAYIGLAGAYRAKGMLFDSKRILDEVTRKFKRNPTVETMLQILEED